MRAIVCVAALFAATAQAGEKSDIKYSVEHLDKSWSLAVKSAATKEVTLEKLGDTKFIPPKKLVEVRITLEFAGEAASAKEMRRRFVIESKMPKVGELALKEPQTQLWFLDGDGVELKKMEPWALEGEITGVQGDAFRVIVYVEPELLKKTKRIDLRPAKQ
ncbi:MAG: hypothetical protein U0792_21025 [Gemmataceae bacterium]